MTDTKTVKVTLVRSTAGRIKSHKECVRGLGLRRIGSSAVLEDTACVRGMIDRVRYLIRVEGA